MPQAGLEKPAVQSSTHYVALTEYLSGEASLQQTLDKFSEPVEHAWTSSNLEEVQTQLDRGWTSIVSHAAQALFGETGQQRLVDFVLSLQQRPVLQKDGQTCQVHGMTVWRELPTFGRTIRDAWNFAAKEDSDQKSKDQWVNINTFAAMTLASVHSKTEDEPDFSLFCIWTLRQALEDPSGSDVDIAAAATWFVHAGPAIYSLCLKNKSYEGKLARPGASFQDKSWTGFTQDRWQAWTQRFTVVKDRLHEQSAIKLVEQAQAVLNKTDQQR